MSEIQCPASKIASHGATALDPDTCLMLKRSGNYLDNLINSSIIQYHSTRCVTLSVVLQSTVWRFLQLAYPSQNNDRGGTVRVQASRADMFTLYCHGYLFPWLLHLSRAHLLPLTSGRIFRKRLLSWISEIPDTRTTVLLYDIRFQIESKSKIDSTRHSCSQQEFPTSCGLTNAATNHCWD